MTFPAAGSGPTWRASSCAMPSGRSAPIPPDRPTATAANTGRGSGERGVPHRPGGTPRSAGALTMQHIDEEVPHVPAFTTHHRRGTHRRPG